QAQAGLNSARAGYPDDPRWQLLQAEIEEWRIGAVEARVREFLRSGDGVGAEAELNSGRVKFPDEPRWGTLKAEITSWQARQRQNEVAGIEQRVRQLLEAEHGAQAEGELNAA